jgi:hypothetical protein
VRHERALAETFTQVLGLCAQAGLVSVGVLALDGTTIAANAAWASTRTHASIREEVERILSEAAEADAREDQQFGETRGEELPAELADRRSRLARLRRCRDELEAEQARAEQAHREHLQRRADWEAEHGRKLTGRKPSPQTRPRSSPHRSTRLIPIAADRPQRTSAGPGLQRAGSRDYRADHRRC